MRACHSIATLLSLAAALAAQDSRRDGAPVAADALTTAWQSAKEQAKLHKAPILAFVLPAADATVSEADSQDTWQRERAVGIRRAYREKSPPAGTARELMLRQMQLLRCTGRDGGNPGRFGMDVRATRGNALFALTVPVVATAATCQAEPGETAVLFGSDGKRVQGFRTKLSAGEAFVAEVAAVVLEPRALAARAATVPPEVARDVAALPVKRGDEMAYIEDPELATRLVSNLPAAAPALVRWVDGELDIHHLLWSLEDRRDPLGTERRTTPEDHCLGCGMGFTPPSLTGTLKLIGP
ncbi:MAG: hypothetical protein MUC36_11080 [Planctomycetes bacterium]|jgi:hypothetical protein|nr:hypothetical protein [Planctomycetota bacterium]